MTGRMRQSSACGAASSSCKRTPDADTNPKESKPPPHGVVPALRPRRIIGSRSVVRRLYSTFAGGWPGIGLLLMRLVVGTVILWHVSAQLWNEAAPHMVAGYALLGLGGLLLVVGLWTPIAGVIVAAIGMSEMLMTGDRSIAHVLAATIAGALAMLGPGRLSIDARLFGWKRIDARTRPNRSSIS
jgi:hypothetical protein